MAGPMLEQLLASIQGAGPMGQGGGRAAAPQPAAPMMPGVAGAGGRAAVPQQAAPSPMPGVGGGGGRAVQPALSPSVVGLSEPMMGGGGAPSGGGGGGLSSPSGFIDSLIGGGSGGKVKGKMEDYLIKLINQSNKLLDKKAPTYTKDRVADPTKALDNAKDSLFQAQKQIRNPNPRWSATAQSFLKPDTFSTKPGLLGKSFTKPVAQPRAVGNMPQE